MESTSTKPETELPSSTTKAEELSTSPAAVVEAVKEEEKEECGWCKWMKGGECKPEFVVSTFWPSFASPLCSTVS